MGVVRREGDWRLEKQDEGVYLVTYQESPEMKILTSDYTQRGLVDERADFSMPVREVESFSEAESVFEATASREPAGMGGVAGVNADPPADMNIAEDTGELPPIPPIGVFSVGLAIGLYLINQSGLAFGSALFLIGAAFLLVPLAVVALAYRVYTSEGLGAAIEYLFTIQQEEASDPSETDDDGPEKTPPAPESLKNELYFQRAERQCEWCWEDVDSPDTHHIKPREEGGPNEYENLIVLCPNCHRKADRGMISRSKLRHRVSKQMADWEKEPA